MSANAISSTDFNLLLNRSGQSPRSDASASGKLTAEDGEGVASSFAVRLAEFRSQTITSLMVTSFGGSGQGTDVNTLFGSPNSAADAPSGLSALTGAGAASTLSASGRNTSLFDPESGYGMMSYINRQDVAFKAQFSELSEMQTAVTAMQHEGEDLSRIDAATDAQGIKDRLASFVERFNDWTERFDADMRKGGVLAGTQAAEVSRHELRASIQNPFLGAANGLHGLRDLGITIDDHTRQAVIDPALLDSALARNASGVVSTVQAFGAHFARSAELLNSEGNFIPNRLNNLDRVIHYIDANGSALRAEFGTGDAAKPSGQVAAALAAYNKMRAA